MSQTTTTVRFAAATSALPDTAAALDEVLTALHRRLAGTADLALVFATPHHRDGFDLIARRLTETLAPSVALGTTAEGVIGVAHEIERSAGLSILAATLPGVGLQPLHSDPQDWPAVLDSADSFRRRLGVADDRTDQLRAVLLFTDPFSTPMSRVLQVIDEAYPGVPVVGGMASGAQAAGGNRLLLNDQVYAQGAVGVGLVGPLRVDCVVSQGCRPIGHPFVITKAKRHLVQELGGHNALAVIRQMIQDIAEDDRQLLSHGLLVGRVISEYRDRFGRGDFLIRAIVGVDEDHGYVAIGDPNVRVGQTIQFHVRDQKTAREDFQMMLAPERMDSPAAGALLVTCNGRGTRLFDQPGVDAGIVHEALGDVPLAGFFAAGEFGPVGNQSFVHGHTASLVLFRSPPGR